MSTSTAKMMAIMEVAKTRSLNDKIALLKKHPELRGILKACYDPYLHYYIKPTASWITNVGREVFGPNEQDLLVALSRRALSGNAAKRAVMKSLSSLEPLSQELLLRILNKDMAFGLQAKSINRAFPDLVPTFAVQLAKTYEPNKIEFPCYGSFKIDGLRCIYEGGALFSRNGKRFVGLDHIAEKIAEFNLSRVDGEIVVQGKSFDDISGDIRSFSKNDNAVLMVFDAHPIGDPAPMYRRQAIASSLVTAINDPSIVMVEHRILNSEEETMAMFDEARALGYEGLVVKKSDALPFNGRNTDWMKIKPKDTVDIEVTAVVAGNGKYADKVGTLMCNFMGKEVFVGGGMTDEQRDAWAKDPNAIVGKTIEVEFMEISKYGALRHPRLIKVRTDK